MKTEELSFRMEKVASVKGADCPHLLMEAAKRLRDISADLNSCKRQISRMERWNNRKYANTQKQADQE